MPKPLRTGTDDIVEVDVVARHVSIADPCEREQAVDGVAEPLHFRREHPCALTELAVRSIDLRTQGGERCPELMCRISDELSLPTVHRLDRRQRPPDDQSGEHYEHEKQQRRAHYQHD